MSLAFEEVCKALEIQRAATREREAVAVRIIELSRSSALDAGGIPNFTRSLIRAAL
jgi:hypothetical protein